MIISKLNQSLIRGGIYCSKRTYSSSNPIVFIDGVRTPFLASLTDFQYMMPHQLLAQAYTGLLSRTGVTGEQAKLYVPSSTIKTQIKLLLLAWLGKLGRQSNTKNFCNLAKSIVFQSCCFHIQSFSLHCSIHTKKVDYKKVRKWSILALKCTFLGQNRLNIYNKLQLPESVVSVQSTWRVYNFGTRWTICALVQSSRRSGQVMWLKRLGLRPNYPKAFLDIQSQWLAYPQIR